MTAIDLAKGPEFTSLKAVLEFISDFFTKYQVVVFFALFKDLL